MLVASIAHIGNVVHSVATNTGQEAAPKWTEVAGFIVAIVALLVSAVLALVTGLLFYATLAVASRTADLATDTLSAADLTDLHHQEQLTPILVFRPGHISVVGSAVEIIAASPSIPIPLLMQVGTGPAVETHLRLEFKNVNDEVFALVEKSFGPIGSGQSVELTGFRENLVFQQGITPHPNQQQGSCVMILSCTNLFGSKAVTRYQVRLGQPQHYEASYTRPEPSRRAIPRESLTKTWIEKLFRL